MKAEYMNTSIKRAVLLTKPTTLQPVPPTEAALLKEIADYVDVGMTMTEVLERLKKMHRIGQSQALPRQLLNITGKMEKERGEEGERWRPRATSVCHGAG